MTSETTTRPDSEQAALVERFRKLHELYADAPEVGRVGLDKIIGDLKERVSGQQRATSAGRAGLRIGKVSELTLIADITPAGAKRMRALLDALGGNFQAADKVGTLHDMRFVFLENDTKVLFCTAYDGEWDPYIDDFATKIPEEMDVVFCNVEGWPGIRSPEIKDWIISKQHTADGWYVALPNQTVAKGRRLEKVGKAVDEFLDAVG